MSNGGDSLATKAATGHKSTHSSAGKDHNKLVLRYSCSNFYILIFGVCLTQKQSFSFQLVLEWL